MSLSWSHCLSRFLFPSRLLDFGRAWFGHSDFFLAVGVVQRSLQASRPAFGVGGRIAGSPWTELVLTVTDVFFPVAGDLAVDLVGAVFAGGLPEPVPTVALVRDTLPVLGLSRGALGCSLGPVQFTFVSFSFASAGVCAERQRQEQQQRHRNQTSHLC